MEHKTLKELQEEVDLIFQDVEKEKTLGEYYCCSSISGGIVGCGCRGVSVRDWLSWQLKNLISQSYEAGRKVEREEIVKAIHFGKFTQYKDTSEDTQDTFEEGMETCLDDVFHIINSRNENKNQ